MKQIKKFILTERKGQGQKTALGNNKKPKQMVEKMAEKNRGYQVHGDMVKDGTAPRLSLTVRIQLKLKKRCANHE